MTMTTKVNVICDDDIRDYILQTKTKWNKMGRKEKKWKNNWGIKLDADQKKAKNFTNELNIFEESIPSKKPYNTMRAHTPTHEQPTHKPTDHSIYIIHILNVLSFCRPVSAFPSFRFRYFQTFSVYLFFIR